MLYEVITITAIYTPTATDIANGSVTLTYTTNDPDSGGPCTSVDDSMVLTINAIPTVEAGGPDTVCQSASPSPITLSGAIIGGGASTAAWSIV